MINDEREMIVCCAQLLLDLPVRPDARDTLELIVSALCTFAVADSKERNFIMDGQYREIQHIQMLMDHTGEELKDAKAWVREILSRPRQEEGYYKHSRVVPVTRERPVQQRPKIDPNKF